MRRILGALALAVGLMAPAVAAAQSEVPRVIVLRFAGPRADAAREAVMIEIASYVELVAEDQAVATAEAMGVDVSSPDGMARVVEEMGISLVVAGSVEGRRGPLRLTVVNPRGEPLARRDAPYPSDSATLGAAAVQAIEDAQAELRRREAEARAAEQAAAAAAVAEAQPLPPDQLDPVQTEPETPSEPLGGWRQPVLQLLVGTRLRVETMDALGEDGRGPFFATDAYPELDAKVVVRPLASAPDLSRGLYLAAEGGVSLGIRYLGELGDTRDMMSFRLRIDAGFGYSGEVFEIVGMVGLGVDGVSLDQSDGFESYALTYLRPGALGRVQLFETYVVAELGLGGRVGLDAGSLAAAYGPGLAFGGVDLFLGLGGIVEGFTYAARFGYSYVALGYDGAGPRFDAASGTHEAFEGRLLLGYSLR